MVVQIEQVHWVVKSVKWLAWECPAIWFVIFAHIKKGELEMCSHHLLLLSTSLHDLMDADAWAQHKLLRPLRLSRISFVLWDNQLNPFPKQYLLLKRYHSVEATSERVHHINQTTWLFPIHCQLNGFESLCWSWQELLVFSRFRVLSLAFQSQTFQYQSRWHRQWNY